MKRLFAAFSVLVILAAMSACPPVSPPDDPGNTPEPGLIDDWPDETILQRTDASTFAVTALVEVTNNDASLTKLSVVIPVPRSNIYQEVTNINLNGAEELIIEDTSDKYARFIATTSLPAPGGNISFSISYTATIYAIHADTNSIGQLYPYDTSSDIHKYYLGDRIDSDGNKLIDITFADIIAQGDLLWGQSSDLLDYAVRCYEYTANSFDYINPMSGLLPVETIYGNGGGDCANLASIFVSLLRYKNIPARHIITVRPHNESSLFHVWADFYLEGYGWIPVDASAAVVDSDSDGSLDGDYFGDISLANNGIVMSKEVAVPLLADDTHEVIIGGLQSFAWWYWGAGTAAASFTFDSTQLK